jgi:hypothetical protein
MDTNEPRDPVPDPSIPVAQPKPLPAVAAHEPASIPPVVR